jgi:hypothetical protein
MFASIIAIPLNHAFKWLSEEHLFYLILAANMAMYFWYITNVIWEISSYLGVHCLTIKKKDD